MPRTRRIVLPGYSHHIMQRGHNKQAVFKGEGDYLKFIDDMREFKAEFKVNVHAWSMTSNEVHLLLNPGDNKQALAAFMKGISARATRHRNRLEPRTGTLWEGRYRSSPVHEDWVLACVRHIERIAVERGLVENPGEYRWSSCAAHSGLRRQPWLDPCAGYLALGQTTEQRYQRYRAYVAEEPSSAEKHLIENAVLRNQLTGEEAFADEVERIIGVRVPSRGRGRPKKRDREDE